MKKTLTIIIAASLFTFYQPTTPATSGTTAAPLKSSGGVELTTPTTLTVAVLPDQLTHNKLAHHGYALVASLKTATPTIAQPPQQENMEPLIPRDRTSERCCGVVCPPIMVPARKDWSPETCCFACCGWSITCCGLCLLCPETNAQEID
jgi:hypothetical protein